MSIKSQPMSPMIRMNWPVSMTIHLGSLKAIFLVPEYTVLHSVHSMEPHSMPRPIDSGLGRSIVMRFIRHSVLPSWLSD